MGGAWDAFALDNDGAAATVARVLGTDLLVHVTGDQTRSLLDTVLWRVRRKEREAILPFRCDSPDRERHMEMTLRAEPGQGVLLAYRMLRSVPLPFALPLNFSATGLPRGRMLFRCSTCNRLLRDGLWREPASLDEQPTVPIAVSYGVCADCRATVERLLPE
ncbi:hypothetical protein CH341_23405 [Rhodoplanes roseus]|uniref:Uncharacterized protein n=1 Tax=Rhodoplanes roseus TaxID=29409 RepID=A0A327KT77_9BRAD|nr:hypothetical protein CH341_23405 [Rhodoplanes roseus]